MTPPDRSSLARWTVVGLALCFMILCGVLRIAIWTAFSQLVAGFSLRLALTGLLTLVLTVAATAVLLRARPALAQPDLHIVFGLRARAARHLVFGLLVGAALFALLLAIVWALGGVTVAWRPTSSSLAKTILVQLVVFTLFAAWEEYVFRGWAFSICAKALSPNLAVIGLGLVFGLAHLGNPNPSVIAITSVTSAGIFLGYAMLASRNILFPIAIHAGWNFVQDLLTSPPYVAITRSPKAWLSGGEWGLEGSVVAIGIMTLAATIAHQARKRSISAVES